MGGFTRDSSRFCFRRSAEAVGTAEGSRLLKSGGLSAWPVVAGAEVNFMSPTDMRQHELQSFFVTATLGARQQRKSP